MVVNPNEDAAEMGTVTILSSRRKWGQRKWGQRENGVSHHFFGNLKKEF